MRKTSTELPAGQSAVPPAPAAPQTVRVAYHDGPPELTFYNHAWIRGMPQALTREDWEAMQKRGDFGEFDFKLEQPLLSPAPATNVITEE